jgi:hypothetical protein
MSDVGNLGEAAVTACLDWPATPTTAAQDLGTDLLLAVHGRATRVESSTRVVATDEDRDFSGASGERRRSRAG